jgi:hypothetical protein
LNYNCIAWAANDLNRYWWPSPHPRYYWPNGFPLANTIENFVITFGAQTFQVCEHQDLETGYEKVALYAKDGGPTHMARMLPNGRWTSKLGDMWDIEHKTLEGLEGSGYGQVVKLLKRPIPEIA